MRVVASLVVLACEVSGVGAQKMPRAAFEPIDEAVEVPALHATRAAVLDALRRRDREGLERWMADRVNGTDSERRILLDQWTKEGEPADRLADALLHGGAFVDPMRAEFCAPYWSARPPRASDLPQHLVFEGLPWAVIVPGAVVRREPREAAPEIGRLSLELVQVFPDAAADSANRYVRVAHGDGLAFVSRTDVREIEDAGRACFSGRGDVWRLTTFK